jgi:hypothetical protein
VELLQQHFHVVPAAAAALQVRQMQQLLRVFPAALAPSPASAVLPTNGAALHHLNNTLAEDVVVLVAASADGDDAMAEADLRYASSCG